MRNRYFLFITLFSLLIGSCKKEDDGFIDAVVVDSGNITKDGCGYLLRFADGTEEKPYQLLSTYQHNGLEVQVKYHQSDILDTCGSSAPFSYYQLIIVDDIRNKK
jgi:hypothetical protein